MTNPTSNFGWQMPTPTDLVTDLPADFEVFGQAVDTSMADLKGGTTGQILSKATNTDMDFTWITNDVGDITAVNVTAPITGGGSSGAVTIGVSAASTSASGVVQLSDSTSTTSSVLASTPTATKAAYDLADAAIAKSTLTTAGDTIYRNATVPARLGIGTAGQVLTVNSGATAPEWSTPVVPSSFSNNGILNSAFQIWQRGTSIAGATAVNYAADQWQLFRAGTTLTRQATGDTTNLSNIQYCARVQRNSGTSGTSAVLLSQSLETLNAIPYAGKTVTLSFYARKGANYSGASSGMGATVFTGTGTDQNYISGFTGVATAFTFAPTLTSTWQRFTQTGSIASTATELAVNFSYEPVGTAGANDYFEVTGVQLEVGSSATAFHTNQPTIATELAACQRYYYRIGGSYIYEVLGTGNARSTTVGDIVMNFPVTMRTAPTALDFSTVALLRDFSSSPISISSIAFSGAGKNSVVAGCTVASGLTAGQNYYTVANNSTSAYLAVSAEL
jgi:hypothetical protein